MSTLVVTSEQYKLKFLQFASYTKVGSENSILDLGNWKRP